ncbi:hypothetical protein BSKO_03318 [Bryopsis sp. KO-2023]|nr:hypothetical protein BSKO_03318 [Bryopsis sp. KO-2023]
METSPSMGLWIWGGKLKVFPGALGNETTSTALNRDTGEEAVAWQLRVYEPDTDAARKILKEFKGQVDRLIGLNHRNVLKFFYCHVEEWTSLTLLCDIYGKKLHHVMQRYAVPLPLAKKFLSQILNGLEFLLSHGISLVVSLRNVCLTDNGTVKLRVVLRDLEHQKSLRECIASLEPLGRTLFSSHTPTADDFAKACQVATNFQQLRKFTTPTPLTPPPPSPPPPPPEAIQEDPASTTPPPRETQASLQQRVEKRAPGGENIAEEGTKRQRGLAGERLVVGISRSKKSSMRRDFVLWRKEVLSTKTAKEVEEVELLDPQGTSTMECVDLMSDDGSPSKDGPSKTPRKGNAQHPRTNDVAAQNGREGGSDRIEGLDPHQDGIAVVSTDAAAAGNISSPSRDSDALDGAGKLNLFDAGGPSTPMSSMLTSENADSASKLPTARKSSGPTPVLGKRDQLKRKAAIEGVKRRRLSLRENARRTMEVPKNAPQCIDVPSQILKRCHRPEPNVYVEEHCYDFTYLPSLLPSSLSALATDVFKQKTGDYRKVLRFGTQFKVFVGKHGIHTGKGRGVVALEPILKNRCVFEYTGALLSEEEATGAGEQYFFEIADHQQDDDYKELATYRLPNGQTPTIIDATNKGNASRFLNHSCLPNLEVLKDVEKVETIFKEAGVFRIIMRAVRDILKGEELTIDYHPNDTRQTLEECAARRKVPCCCGAEDKCKKWIVLSGEVDDEGEDEEEGKEEGKGEGEGDQ